MYQDLQLIITLILIPILLLIFWRLRLKRLKKYISPRLGIIEVWQKYNRELLLTINTYAQGVSINDDSIKKSYWYKVAELTIVHTKKNPQPKILMLGLGANTISSLIAKLNPKVYQIIVEFDEAIIQACRDFFNLDQLPNHQIIQADVYQLLNKQKAFNQKFDAILVDVFTGKPPYISLKSNQPNFIEKLLPYLQKEGVAIFNRPGNTEAARGDSKEFQKYLQTLFQKTDLLDIKDPRGYRNNVIMAWRRTNLPLKQLQ